MLATGDYAPNYDYRIILNGKTLREREAVPEGARDVSTLDVPIADLLVGRPNRLQLERGEGEGALYYSAYFSAMLPVPEVEPLARGFVVERRYTRPGDDSHTSITRARVGETLQARLTVVVTEPREYVIIEDPLPAGVEAINPNLATSEQIGTRPTMTRLNDDGGWGWWWFSNIEFRDEKVILYATYLPAGTYEFVYSVQVGLPGVYNVIPATAHETYAPDVYGRSAGSSFTITD
jgi:uncharacterized protein YfaS (alpha-2-macroglobulin family)